MDEIKMRKTSEYPSCVFLDEDSANNFVNRLGVDDTYNCTYVVKRRPGNTFVVEILDEVGNRIGYF